MILSIFLALLSACAIVIPLMLLRSFIDMSCTAAPYRAVGHRMAAGLTMLALARLAPLPIQTRLI